MSLKWLKEVILVAVCVVSLAACSAAPPFDKLASML
jgi:hypothetical protein